MNMWIFLIGILLLGIFASVVAAAPVTQVTAHILDEQGQAIEGAHVSIVMTNAEAKYILTFSNPGDGIQIFVPDESNQSVFKWPFSAPLDGYQPRLEKEEAYLPGQGQRTNIMKDIQYIFRVRTGQETGTIRGPLYGKINGEINISRDGYIDFTYWLNPDGTPNLEEDPDRNLFDEVRRPQKSLRDILLERQQQQKQP